MSLSPNVHNSANSVENSFPNGSHAVNGSPGPPQERSHIKASSETGTGTGTEPLIAPEFFKEMRGWLMIVAILAAGSTYQAGLNPPGGVWQTDDEKHDFVAGTPVLHDKFFRRYQAFFYCNAISFLSSLVRYAEHLPSVLRGVTCVVPGRKKVGVVGRTGSGKSTFIQALFRLVEPRQGTIEIDNIDICKIGLYDLRSRLAIFHKNQHCFEGTVRGNLDPLNEYRDEEIWEVLDKCQLGDLIRECEKKLDSSGRAARGKI